MRVAVVHHTFVGTDIAIVKRCFYSEIVTVYTDNRVRYIFNSVIFRKIPVLLEITCNRYRKLVTDIFRNRARVRKLCFLKLRTSALNLAQLAGTCIPAPFMYFPPAAVPGTPVHSVFVDRVNN